MLPLYDDVFSPYARKVRIALCNRTAFVHVNPHAEVPALGDGSFSLHDSTIICGSLGDRTFFPLAVAGRAPNQVPRPEL